MHFELHSYSPSLHINIYAYTQTFFLDLHELDSQNIYIYGRMSAQRERKNGTVNHLKLEVGDITVCEKR